MKRNIFKILKSQTGVTLVELMVYVGMLGGVSLLIATLGVNLNRSNVAREADLLASEFMQEFQAQLSQKGMCDYNFEGENSTSAGAGFKYPNEIRNSDGTTFLSVGQELDNYFTLSDISIAKINDTRADITLKFSRTSTSSNAVTSFARKLKLTVVHETDGTTVNKCLVSFDQGVGNQLPLVCNGEGVILSDSGTPGDESDDVCIHAGYSMERCPDTEYVQRFELVNIDDGSGKLQPFYRPVCVAADIPRSLLCPAGEVLQGYSAIDGLICRSVVASDVEKHFMGDYTSCALNEEFPIQMVGSNNNIHCGAAISTPTATATGTASPTPTASDPDHCITVNSQEFALHMPLVSPLTPVGNQVRISITGIRKDGTTIIIGTEFGGRGASYPPILKMATNLIKPYPGFKVYYYPDLLTQNHLYIVRTNELIGEEGEPGGFQIGTSSTHPTPALTTDFCSFGVYKENCGYITSSPFTGLEQVSPLTICADDSYSTTRPMYNYSSPFNVL